MAVRNGAGATKLICGTAIVSTFSPVVTIGVAIVVLGNPFVRPGGAYAIFVFGGVGPFSLIEPCGRSYPAGAEGPA